MNLNCELPSIYGGVGGGGGLRGLGRTSEFEQSVSKKWSPVVGPHPWDRVIPFGTPLSSKPLSRAPQMRQLR